MPVEASDSPDTAHQLNRLPDRFRALERYVPLLVWVVAILTILVIPLKVISYGYLPVYDDALPDAAKAVNGKPWPEIVVLRNSYTMDHHIGWHTLLRQVHLHANQNAEGLVIFSVVGLFLMFAGSAFPWLKRPEAWLGAFLLMAGVSSNTMTRFTYGRPLMVTMFALITILFLWQTRGDSRPGWKAFAGMTLAIALAVLLHGIWYFWALPLAAFVLAGQFRWAVALGVSWIAGTVIAAILTGHPMTYLLESLQLGLRVMSSHENQRTLVTELRPSSGNSFPLLVMGTLLATRQFARLNVRPLSVNPAFWLACVGWIFGHKASRFWEDWGLPALMVLVAVDFQALVQARIKPESLKRLALTCMLALATFLATTSDLDGRWSSNLTTQYLEQNNPQLAGWLPEKNGIFYDVDMFFFYQTFFKNPTAEWRYMVGNEPALMPEEDLATYQKILWSNGDPRAYRPWVDKMLPADRLVIRAASRPPIPQLEWTYAQGVWIGRLPRPSSSDPTTPQP